MRCVIVSIFLLLAGPVTAQDLSDTDTEDVEIDLIDEFTLLQEDSFVELAARHKQEIGMSPSAISVITREDIEASGATTIADLLRQVPGMEVVITTPYFTSITSRLMWTYENNIYLVLVDGREANVEMMGFAPFELQPISLDDIQRIEIIRGPGSSLYGANAVAGVISITTRAITEETSAWAGFSGGQGGLLIGEARASTRIGNLGLSVGGGVDTMGTFIDPRAAGREIYKLRSAAEYRLSGERRFLLDMGLSRGKGSASSAIGAIDMKMQLHYLRLAYESETVNAQLYWSHMRADGTIDAPLELGGIHLAEFANATGDAHTIDGEVQWALPRLWNPLLLIVGGGGRFSWIDSGNFLDAETFADITSPDYHKPGIFHWEVRAGAFIHAEISPSEWMTLTGGLRFDYNTVTSEFLSPRLAAVFKPAPGHYFRMGVARAFRKPAFLETHLHIMVDFPSDSPITGAGQDGFREFMTRVIGNDQLANEKLLAFEMGYLAQFLDGMLSLDLQLYYNIYTNRVEFTDRITLDEQGLPDIAVSSLMFENQGDQGIDIFGGELTLRYNLSRAVSFVFSWVHREVVYRFTEITCDESPKNMFTLGGRFRTGSGLVGSLFVFVRSEFNDPSVENPAGMLQPALRMHLDNQALFIGKLGWKFPVRQGFELEVGARLYLPFSPFAGSLFRIRERGGAVSAKGQPFGGIELAPQAIGYLQGSF
jgi:outer membrane receptor protein involved in Fe transport